MGSRVMLIALDYDFTFTNDPVFWNAVIAHGRSRGHEFICVTGRDAPPGRDEPAIGIPVVCAPGEPKFRAAMRAGYAVDVWIDDAPGTIAPSSFLSFEDEPLAIVFPPGVKP